MKKIVIFIEALYEDMELWYPKIRLEEAGHQVYIAGPVANETYLGKHGYPCRADLSFKEASERQWNGLIIPGGFAPDRLRRSLEVLKLVQIIDREKKLIAFICHGGWVTISAKILKGKKATGTVAIKDDLENAGAIWHDQPVVIDGHLISSRTPADLPEFLKAILHVI